MPLVKIVVCPDDESVAHFWDENVTLQISYTQCKTKNILLEDLLLPGPVVILASVLKLC